MDIQEAIEHLNDVLNDDDRWTDCAECKEEHEQLREFMEELQQYRQIGTVEECRATMEKQTPKKVRFKTKNSVFLPCCPNCGETYCDCSGGENYCKNCGQKWEWGE